MAKKIKAQVKIQLPAGKAAPGSSLGSALGPHGIAIPMFTKAFNEQTQDLIGLTVPAIITIYEDRSFTFILKTPPAADLIKKALNLKGGSAKPNKAKVGSLTQAQLKEIAQVKYKDLGANSVEAAMKMVAGTARSMGVTITE